MGGFMKCWILRFFRIKILVVMMSIHQGHQQRHFQNWCLVQHSRWLQYHMIQQHMWTQARIATMIGKTNLRVHCPNMPPGNFEVDMAEGCSSPVSKGSTCVPLSPTSSENSFKTVTPPPGLGADESANMMLDLSMPPPGLEEVQSRSVANLATWNVVQIRRRLRQKLGKPLVSPCFSLGPLNDIRLLLFPKFANEKAESAQGKHQRSRYLKMVSQGPLACELKLKIPCPDATTVKFFVTLVGVTNRFREGPFECNFADKTVHGFGKFDMNWLSEVCSRTDSVVIELDIVEIVRERS